MATHRLVSALQFSHGRIFYYIDVKEGLAPLPIPLLRRVAFYVIPASEGELLELFQLGFWIAELRRKTLEIPEEEVIGIGLILGSGYEMPQDLHECVFSPNSSLGFEVYRDRLGGMMKGLSRLS